MPRVVKVEWDKPFPIYSNGELGGILSYELGHPYPVAAWVQNPNPLVTFDDGTVQRVEPEDLSTMLGREE